jgi:hypothetical protein
VASLLHVAAAQRDVHVPTGRHRRPGRWPLRATWCSWALALLVSACDSAGQPRSANAPTASSAPGEALQLSSASPSDSGYLSGLDATAFTAAAETRGLSCDEYSSDDQPSQRVWSCTGDAADGSELLMGAQGPDRTRLVFATAEVLGSGPVEDEIVLQFLGPISSLFAGADGVRAQAWLLTALPDAQRDGAAETDIGANHFRLRFDDNGPGTPSATYLLVMPLAAP